jgi:hypothetical protein
VADGGKVPNRTHIPGMATPEEMVERKARREEQAAEGKVAMAEYLAEPEQRAANTARLREARLAREAAAALLSPPVKKPSKKKKPTA